MRCGYTKGSGPVPVSRAQQTEGDMVPKKWAQSGDWMHRWCHIGDFWKMPWKVCDIWGTRVSSAILDAQDGKKKNLNWAIGSVKVWSP